MWRQKLQAELTEFYREQKQNNARKQVNASTLLENTRE